MSPTTAADPIKTIQDQITASIASGVAPKFDLNLLLQIAIGQSWPADQAAVPVRIDMTSDPLKGGGLYRLTALFPGVPLAQWLPGDSLLHDIVSPNPAIQV